MSVVAPVGLRSLRKVCGLRVLALMTDFYGVSGGIAEYNRFFIKALSENATVEKIVTLPRRSQRHQEKENPKVLLLKARANKWQYALSAMATLMTKGPFDVIWCGHLYMSPLAQWLTFISRAKLWIQIHGVEAWQRPSNIIRRAVNCATQVSCVSRYSRKIFLGWANVAPEKVKVLPNTYDEKRFYRGVKNDDLLNKFSSKDKRILLTVGRLASGEMYKGHEAVIRLLPELLKKDTGWIYWIAGEGDDRPRLETLTQELGVGEQVRFLGFVQRESLPDLYRTADVFIMLSKGEGFGIVYLEAIACGLPVIAAVGDGSVDPLLDGRAGQLVDGESLKDVLFAIKQSFTRGDQDSEASKIFSYGNFSECLRALSYECIDQPYGGYVT
jgi:phosphatidylinositol alpha-1,6-mannosyltransferase